MSLLFVLVWIKSKVWYKLFHYPANIIKKPFNIFIFFLNYKVFFSLLCKFSLWRAPTLWTNQRSFPMTYPETGNIRSAKRPEVRRQRKQRSRHNRHFGNLFMDTIYIFCEHGNACFLFASSFSFFPFYLVLL